MSRKSYGKTCQGCGKVFRNNRSRKKHILGHTYRNRDGLQVIFKCSAVPDDKREEYASYYTLVETAPSPCLDKDERQAA